MHTVSSEGEGVLTLRGGGDYVRDVGVCSLHTYIWVA